MDNSILAIYNKENSVLGTGFVIDSDDDGVFMATCGHVVNDCGDNILVEGVTPKIIKNEYGEGIDLAILYVRGVHLPPLSIQVNEMTSMAKVIGYSKMLGDPIKEPIHGISVKTKVEIKKSDALIISTLGLDTPEPISYGYSGSPVICADSKNVVGVVCIQKNQSKNYAICCKHLLELYPKSHKEEVKLPTLYKKIGITSVLSDEENFAIKHTLSEKLNISLSSFIAESHIWIEPQIYNVTERTQRKNVKKHNKVDIKNIIDKPRDLTINAPQQYGSTSLALYLCKEAWGNDVKSFWLYLDASTLVAKKGFINKIISRKLRNLKLTAVDVECIVLDEFSCALEDSGKIIDIIDELFSNTPLIIVNTIKENPLLSEKSDKSCCKRNFEKIYLWALPRHSIRELVKIYNTSEEYIANEDKVVNKILSDLEAINIPRTPQNCLTILKISEDKFDDSPINRADMISRILNYIFNTGYIPKYKTRPDLLDTEHTMGYFCELMIKNKKYLFTEQEFTETLTGFCEENEIDLDIFVIFQILRDNNILACRGDLYYFKFSYWVFYFSAHRMLNDSEFASFILSEMNYINYPEIIEFYTGIDRKRTDAITQITQDLESIRNTVIDKCNFPTDFNVFDNLQWLPTDEGISKLKSDLSEGILNSDLPSEIKDSFADKSYDHVKPLRQDITHILEEYSFLRLMKAIHTGSLTLRNSNYGNLKARHKLLEELLLSWGQLSNVLTTFSPILSENGFFEIEGTTFSLIDDFGGSHEERVKTIITSIPSNIIQWFEGDIFSQKIGTTLLNRAESETNMLHKHLLNLLIIANRPKGWDTYIENYIANANKNSFYLMGVNERLLTEYQFSFASNKSLTCLKKLVKSSLSKHEFGNEKKMNRISDRRIPSRNETNL
jgi:hypothetical protein